MINTLPLRRTILHLAQRFRIDGETFIITDLLTDPWRPINCQGFNYIRSSFFRPDYTQFLPMSLDSQDEGFCLGDGHSMLKMSRQ